MNKRTEQTRWTPKRLLSLLMALIMTLSLLPTAAFAADGDSGSTSGYTITVNNPPLKLVAGQKYTGASATLKGSTGAQTYAHVRFLVSVTQNGTEVSDGSVRIIANDGNQDWNLVESGWGPVAGFSVNASADSTTEIKEISFASAGNYEVTFRLVDVDDSNAVIASGTSNITVSDAYTVSYKPSGGIWVKTPDETTEQTETSSTYKYYIDTASAQTDGAVSYTVKDASVKKVGWTFVGWEANGNWSGTNSVVKTGDQITNITSDITLNAKFEKDYTITFQSEYSGASGLMTSAPSNGTKYTVPVEPTMYGFTFAGWKVTSGSANVTGNEITNIASNITLTAQWTEDGTTPAGSHTVTFLAGAADAYIPFVATATVADGATYQIPTAVPTRKGYTFDGWANGTTTYSAGKQITNVTTDIVLSAKWTATPVTIEITNDNGSDVEVNGLHPNSSIGDKVHFIVKVPAKYNTADLRVTAGNYVSSYIVLSPVDRVEVKNTTTEAVESVVLYYQFTVEEDMTYEDPPHGLKLLVHVDKVPVKTFNVTLPTGAGFDAKFTDPVSDGKFATVDYDGSVSFTVKARPGYTVEGVYANGMRLTPDAAGTCTIKNIKADQSVMVDMAAVQFHTVTYVLDGKQMAAQSVANGSNATLLSAPDKTGYEWDGKWYTNKDYTTAFDFTTEKIIKDTILYGHYTPDRVTISYDLKDGSWPTGVTVPAPVTKTYGLAATLTEIIPEQEGFTFLGWSESDTATAASYLPGATFSKEIENPITLYAVWKANTYTITLPSGTGYSISYSQSTSVAHGEGFEFTITVDGDYAANVPTVSISDPAHGTLAFSGSGNYLHQPGVYHCKITNVTGNQIVSVSATENERVEVTFSYRVVNKDGKELPSDVLSGSIYSYQSVQIGDPASQPELPKLEGYRFVRWSVEQKAEGVVSYPAYTFVDPVMGPMTVYAEMTPITPVVTWPAANEQIGYRIIFIDPASLLNVSGNSGTVAYKDTVRFYVMINPGYDASNIQVGINGQLYTPVSTDGSVYTYEFSAKEDLNKITVVGIGRKDVKVTYYANATDDVEHIPGQQILKYYLPNAADNGTLDKATPKRVGYDFKGWSTDPTDSPDAANLYQPGGAHNFVTDTNLYAIWKATSTTVTLEVSGLRKDSDDNEGQYEGKDITLTAEIKKTGLGTPGGSMRFYKKTIDGTTVLIETVPVTGEKVTLTTPVGEFFNTSNWSETYWVEYFPEEGKGFATSKSNEVAVRVWSAAISWSISGTKIASNGDVLKVYQNTKNNEANAPGDEIADGTMIAGNVYWLEIPKVLALNGGNDPTIGHGYEILWQFMDDSGSWRDYTTTKDSNMVMIDADHSRYSFRANVVPTDPFTKAVDYEADGSLIDNQYNNAGLYTKQTKYVALQKTNTALEVTNAENELASVKINGATSFTKDHLAQFEGQAVTLTATVTKDGGNDGVETGYVKFYRYVDGTNDTLLNTTLISVDANGIATLEVKVSAWDTAKDAAQNLDQFYAVYETNETYETSKSDSEDVYIKSAKLQTPIIESELEGTNGAKATTYSKDLIGLLAGVQHTFKLRQDADQTAKDYSVVALDGRTVDATNYDIKWLKTTGSNEQEVDATGTNQIKVDENKVGNRYRVKLTGKDVFAGSEATSQDAVIGTKQDVTVTVEATDAITKTPVDRENGKYPDVYQLNEITLTATVAAAKGADATMKPTGTVTFYYSVDGNNWTKIGEAKDLAEVAGVMTASIKTDQLPVKANDNTKQDVKITAVYSGDATFNASATVNETEKSITAAAGCTTTNDTVTVYSSVVFNCNDENKKQPTDGDKGIHISVSDGVLKTNEKATLALSDIYTLDRELTDETLRNTIAKLDPDTDYTVRWQKLNGATAIGDAEGTDFANSKRWTDIGATGTTLVLGKVEQNTAYRAVITVNDQPITKGSFGKLDQGVIGTADANDGRQVYYSNVLMPTDTSMTVSVALNTSKIDAENTEGITEGETVTANVYLSGVVGAVPNANVTVTVTNDHAKGNGTAGEYKQILGNKNTVNGWNAFDWDTTGVAPGFYTLTVSATTNTGYAAKEITRSLIVRESSYNIEVGNTNPTYNGHTQGLTVTLDGFDFKGTGINEAANKSWTVKYYDKDNNLVEPTQAGKYTATITLPASAYWTEQTKTVDFIIEKRSVSIADAIAQAKVYDNSTNVNIVEVMLNDAETDQTTNGTGLPTNNVGIINGDSIYAVATEAKLSSANAGDNSFTISTIELRGDDANNYEWDKASYTENIYVSRSQVYGEHGTLELKQGETFPADKVIKMIDQSGREITLGTGTEDYTLTFYYHSDTKIEKTTDISKLGLYTVVARPNQSNYKSGVTMQFNVVETATVPTPATTPKASTLIYLSDTATKYNPAGNAPVTAKNAQGNAVKVEYQTGTTWSETVPSNAGRYLVKATDTNTGDVAYGIYTITKAHPSIDVTPATGLTYNSMPQNGYTGTPTVPTSAESYFTYAGDVAIGYNVQKEGNVDEQAPVDAGTYTVTLHVNETANYTAHEISKSFTIAKKALTIKADSWQTTQYDAFPDMTAGYTGLAAETGDTTPDTSLRDVQIAPEFLYNPTGGKSNYSNDSLDQVGGVAIQPIDALSKNYAITYENGQYTKQRTETNVDFAIHGLPQSSTGTNTVYYGDVIQLYPYGYYTTLGNGSGILEWSVTTAAGFKGTVTIGKETGLLNVNGVGEFTVTLKRGVGEQQIKTEINVTAIQKEAKIALKNVDKVYNGASQTYAYEGNVTVHDELYQPIGNFVDSKLTRTNTARTDVGTQITTAKVTGAWAYQSETYGGKFTINDKEATVAPVADAHIYGTTRTIPSPAYTSTEAAAISNVLTASQTDAYNRLDVHDGYEILVAGTENMNYNVKYTTDETAEDSAVTTYQDVVFTSKTDKYLNDATIYGETPNVLDWTLVNVIGATRDSVDYADNLADFDLPTTSVEQDKDDCTGNKVTYKAANRTTDAADSSNIRYNQDKLEGPRTSTDTNTDENYTLKFNTVKNSGAANYKLTNEKTGNSEATTNALTENSKGFIPATGESNDVSGENFVEGSANIAQRPIKLEKAVDDVQLYWKLSQKQLYTALVNVLKAEENSVGRGLAKGHTIEDLDLSFTIGSTPVDKNNDQPMTGLTVGTQTVTVTVGDTNYKLEGGQYQFDIVLKNIQIEATYTTKTFTGFTVLIKVHNENGTITPLNDAKGLSYKIFKKTGNTIDKTTAYASGTLTYQNRTAYDDKGGLCGVFTATYPQLPLLNSGETYFIQMYEYGVELKTNS